MTIRLDEKQLRVLKEEEEREVTFDEFFGEAKQFLKDLLNKRYVDSQPSELFKSIGYDKEKLVRKMIDFGLLRTKENITEVPKNDGSNKLRSKHTIQYFIPRKRFNEKMDALHKELFGK